MIVSETYSTVKCVFTSGNFQDDHVVCCRVVDENGVQKPDTLQSLSEEGFYKIFYKIKNLFHSHDFIKCTHHLRPRYRCSIVTGCL